MSGSLPDTETGRTTQDWVCHSPYRDRTEKDLSLQLKVGGNLFKETSQGRERGSSDNQSSQGQCVRLHRPKNKDFNSQFLQQDDTWFCKRKRNLRARAEFTKVETGSYSNGVKEQQNGTVGESD